MTDTINILNRTEKLTQADNAEPISKVRITVGVDEDGNEVVYEAGTDTGRVLDINNEWGTQAMAEAILANVRGFEYKPFTAERSLVDPAAEVGDGLSVGGIYSGIFSRSSTFGRLFSSTLSAPDDTEIEHEFAVDADTKTERTFRRIQQKFASELKVQATEISAKVSQVGGSTSSFGWSLTSDSWKLFSGSKEVLNANSSGIEVNGVIKANSGYIGGEDGFTIQAKKIYNNISSMSGTQTSGVYIGTDGIKLGQNFKVDKNGNVTASNGTFDGTIRCQKLIVDGSTISASSFRSGISGGNSYAGSGWGNYSASNVANQAYYGNLAYNGTIGANRLYFANRALGLRTIYYKHSSGATASVTVLCTND